jgi:hypothetical protein
MFCLGFGFVWVDAWSTGGKGGAPRWALDNIKTISEQRMTAIQDFHAVYDPLRATFTKGPEAVKKSPYYVNGRYEMFIANGIDSVVLPSYSVSWEGPPSFTITWTTNYGDAAQSWRTYGGYVREMDEGYADAQAEITAIDLARQRPFDKFTAQQGGVGGAFMTCVALCLNFFVSLLRSLYELIRRLSKTEARHV